MCKKEWVSNCCLTANDNFFSYIIARTKYRQWNYDDVLFLPNKHVELDLYRASSLKQQSDGRDMLFHLDTLFWFRVNQSLLLLLNAACLLEKQQIPIL